MIDYEKLKKSLKNLEVQYKNYQTLDTREELGKLEKEAIKESVIQRFEICYDVLWKTLKRYLKEELGLSELPNSPKPLFRIAYENNLFQNIEDWIRYANARIDTSHDYSEEKSEKTLVIIENFIENAIQLYTKMTNLKWE